MPIFPVGSLNSVNSPYCIKDYKSVNNEFGSLADLRTIVDSAHKKDISVILDWLANHSSLDNSWITSHKDWYLQDGKGNVLSPPGMGWNDVAQLNFNNAVMRLEMIRCMKYWVFTANVDGFRCDYADGPPVDFWKQAIDSLRNITTHNLLLLAEGNRTSNFTVGFDFNFGFSFYEQLKTIYSNNNNVQLIDNLNNSEYNFATNGQQVVRYTSNHDVNSSDGTPMDLFGGKRGAMAALAVISYMKSVPMIYNGQEVGAASKILFPFTSVKINWTVNSEVNAEYKRILAFRNSSNAIRRGKLISYSSADICSFTKEVNGEKVLVMANLRNSSNDYILPLPLANTIWTDVMNGGNLSLAKQVTLQPYSYLVLKQ